MRKERYLLGKNWSNLRTLIAAVISENKISEENFRSLSTNENWKQIEKNIVKEFCSYPKKSRWLWNNFKLDTFSTSSLANRPECCLDKLIEEKETVWYIVNETINEKDKFWFYEGKIKTIQTIIDETWFDEIYIASKKYEWLIVINHHDIIIATGKTMPDKLRKLDFK